MSILEVKNLTYRYARGTPYEKVALSDISFSIQRESFSVILGHTGSGKSTLVSHLNGLVRPESGTVLLDGEDIFAKGYDLRRARARVGLVFQYPEYQLFEETVEADIAFGPKNMGLSREEISARVGAAARALEIRPELLKKSPFELSGGQKRRAAIAGVIAMQPEVLVLDEPAAGLDPRGRQRVMRLIDGYRRQSGSTVLIVSHSMEEAAAYADRLFVLNDGKLFLQGSVDEVFRQAQRLVEIGLDVPPITALFSALRARGFSVPQSVYTPQQAAEVLLPMLKGGDGQ